MQWRARHFVRQHSLQALHCRHTTVQVANVSTHPSAGESKACTANTSRTETLEHARQLRLLHAHTATMALVSLGTLLEFCPLQ